MSLLRGTVNAYLVNILFLGNFVSLRKRITESSWWIFNYCKTVNDKYLPVPPSQIKRRRCPNKARKWETDPLPFMARLNKLVIHQIKVMVKY